jgi:hypothetical protein
MPAMAAGLTDHRWELQEALGARLPPERWKAPRCKPRRHHPGPGSLITVACGATHHQTRLLQPIMLVLPGPAAPKARAQLALATLRIVAVALPVAWFDLASNDGTRREWARSAELERRMRKVSKTGSAPPSA